MPISQQDEIYLVRMIGKVIGYGRIMQIAQQEWRKLLKKDGMEGGEFASGPCVATTVPCQHWFSDENGHCKICCGCGWVTKEVFKLATEKQISINNNRR
jgi:hypothetical protein